MKITYYGHACFALCEGDFTAVVDPYDNLPGYEALDLKANAVYCSHGHSDHAYTDAVTLTEKENPFCVQTVDSFHDDNLGRLRGNNTIHVFECASLRVAHLGDLGHLLSQKQIDALGKVDVLMVPIGGYYTINATEAVKVCLQLNPTVVIPMHYSGKGFGFDEIAKADEFLTKIRPYYPVSECKNNTFDTENMTKQVMLLTYQGGHNQ
jgi:L-ascorbate metabolism protein UlaG (beta-lactamase superfamily)